MKVKKYIGKSVNGFTILDSYIKTLPSGKTTRKVLLRCDDCGKEFERCSGADFEHIKCECKVLYKMPKKKRDKEIEWNGQTYNKTNFCKMMGIKVGTFDYRSWVHERKDNLNYSFYDGRKNLWERILFYSTKTKRRSC